MVDRQDANSSPGSAAVAETPGPRPQGLEDAHKTIVDSGRRGAPCNARHCRREQNDEWQLQHRHMQAEGMARLVPPTIDGEAAYLPSTQITPEHDLGPTRSTSKLHQLDGHYLRRPTCV